MLQAEESSIDLPWEKGEFDGTVKSESRARGTGSRRKGRWQGKGREAGQLQERDEAANLLVHHTQDDQANELIDACLGLPLVEPESRAAIGVRRKQAPLPGGR